MQPADTRTIHWRQNRLLTSLLLLVWGATTFFTIWFARDLQTYTVLGFPVSFYMAAQGLLIIYVAITWIYAKVMNRLDRRHDVRDD